MYKIFFMCGVEGMNLTELIVFVIYFVFMVGIGIYSSPRARARREGLLPGRPADGPWSGALCGASDMSAWC